MTSYLHVICDYAPGDLAWAEVYSAFKAKLTEDVPLHMTAVNSFDTVSTGFIVGQLSCATTGLKPDSLTIFANCAPRKDVKEARQDNEGEGLLYASLKNGVHVIAVNSGYSMSFIRDEILELWSTDAEEFGSQFRSRDFFPRIIAQAVKSDFSFLVHKLEPHKVIPEEPKEVIGYKDSFGNMKTTYREGHPVLAELKDGQRIKITIGSIIRAATVAAGSFNVMEGDLAFAPGSSGHDRRFWELFKRGGSAWEEFACPAVGTKIKIDMTY
ncbi:MAG: hypothetical protein K2Y39_07025 [Candidatus Obscuribacterales bacterium]|nr:hypothetical protein [Candidatus Obscuribacterales bacterium]